MTPEEERELALAAERAGFAGELIDSHLWKSYLLPFLLEAEEECLRNLLEHDVTPGADEALNMVAIQTQIRFIRQMKEKPRIDIENNLRLRENAAGESRPDAATSKVGLPVS